MNNRKIYDIGVIGSGPAAYTSLLYLQNLSVIHFEGSLVGDNGPGGQLTTTTNVDNYPGFPQGIQGPELIENMQSQYKGETISENVIALEEITIDSFYKNFIINDKNKDVVNEEQSKIDEYKKIKIENNFFKISTEDDNIFYSKSVIIATGAQAKRLYVPGTNDNEFWQKGVSSCAICDGWVFKDKKVIVIGGGDSAMEEASYLSNIASEVILIHRNEHFKARKDMLKNVKNNKKIKIMTSLVLECVRGDKKMNCAFFRNNDTKELLKIEADGLFFAIGHTPNTSFLNEKFLKDEIGYIITDKNCKSSVKGVFTCGDVQDKKYRQAITAAGSGCTAALSVIEYLKKNNF
ncbi:hypothetical protein GVAV_000782 [Gurleya vavrai]